MTLYPILLSRLRNFLLPLTIIWQQNQHVITRLLKKGKKKLHAISKRRYAVLD